MRSRRNNDAGMTLIEVVVAVAVLTVFALFAVQQLLASQQLAYETENARVARLAMESEVERMHAANFKTLAASLVGYTFNVAGLPARANGSAHGRVTVFLNEADVNSPARPVGASSVDLNGNGIVNENLTVAADYRVLPVEIQVTYPSRTDRSELTVVLRTVIAPKTLFQE